MAEECMGGRGQGEGGSSKLLCDLWPICVCHYIFAGIVSFFCELHFPYILVFVLFLFV